METRLEQTAPVREFATAIGEWLLARRFGIITPFAFRWQVWKSYLDDGFLPHVAIELLVNDPPPPPPEWHRLNEKDANQLTLREIGEWAQGQLWPREDMDAVREAAEARARALGIPDGLNAAWPVDVTLRGRTEAAKLGMRFPRREESAALRGEESAGREESAALRGEESARRSAPR